MSRWTRPERRRKAASSRSRQISVFGGSWCWACLVRFLRDLSLLPLQTGPARPPAPPAGSGSQARSPRLGQASVALWSVYFGGAFSWFSPPWLAGGPPGPRWRNAGGDFYFQNHAQVSISEVLFPGSRPRGLPAPPPGARRRRDGDDFHLQNQAQVSISEVLFPDSCSRGLPPPPRRLRTTIVPGFYAPGRQNRRAARKLGDLALEYAVILRSGGAKTACRPRTGRPGPPADR